MSFVEDLLKRAPVCRRLRAFVPAAFLSASAVFGGAVSTRTPVIIVPGVTGSVLEEKSTGNVIWGVGTNLLKPRDGGYLLARPLGLRISPSSRVEASSVLEELRLAGVIHKPVYGPVIRLLEGEGYRRGDLRDPKAHEDFFLFPWDWRQDHAYAAARLAEGLDALRRARSQDTLRVTLICQSTGGYVCRYLAKYGRAALEEAESQDTPPHSGLEVGRLILVGTANGGSIRNLRELDRGRNYLTMVGRKWEPETLFTFPSLFQDLPRYRSDLFVDGDGASVAVDLYDADSWLRYGWSVFSSKARERLARSGAPGLFGEEDERVEYLRWALDRAKRFQALLERNVGWTNPPRYYLIQNDRDRLTPDRAVLRRERKGAWETLFASDSAVKNSPRLRNLVAGRGDGHATVDSQLWLSPEEKEALVGEPLYVRGDHFELILDPAAMEALVEFTRDESRPR